MICIESYLLTLFLGLLLLFTAIPARVEAATAKCSKTWITDTRFEPDTKDISYALDIFGSKKCAKGLDTLYVTFPPNYPGGRCHEVVRYGTAVIRLCAPSTPDREFWKSGVNYSCNDVRAAVMDIMAQCSTEGKGGGTIMLVDPRKGFVTVKKCCLT